MENTLIYDKPINIGNILEFTVPTMIRMLFVSMYTIVDGIVVSNYVGSLGLSAINIVFPVLNICMAVTFVFEMGETPLSVNCSARERRSRHAAFSALL